MEGTILDNEGEYYEKYCDICGNSLVFCKCNK